MNIKYNHRLALEAVRWERNDEILEGFLDQAYREQLNPASFVDHQDLSADGAFRNQYLSLLGSPQECQYLRERLRQIITAGKIQQPYLEWSYSLAMSNDGPFSHEIDSCSDYTQSQYRTSRSLSADSQYQDPTAESRHISEITGLVELEDYPSIARAYSYELETSIE
jgi:hypothetical protein